MGRDSIRATQVSSNSPNPASSALKRKAGNELPKTPAKLQRSDTDRNAPGQQTRTLSISGAAPTNRNASSVVQTSAAPSTTRIGDPQATSATRPAPALKKGSYQEILARAKAAQEMQTTIGVIKHKPAEKMTLRERMAQRAERSQARSSQKRQVTVSTKTGKVKAGTSALNQPIKAPDSGRRQVVQSTYKGTMRPAAASVVARDQPRKLAQSKPRAPASGLKGTQQSIRRTRVVNDADMDDDDEDDEDEEDEADYCSDASSDMEAAAFDVEDEEMLSLRVAKEEDAKELARETEMKKQKLERKNRLDQLVAANAAKKKRF